MEVNVDIGTVLGVLSAFGLLGVAIFSQGNFAVFFNLNAFLIVIGGTFGALLINYPLKEIVKVFRVVKKAFFYRDDDLLTLIPHMVRYARMARKNGVLALDKVLPEIGDSFLYEGLRMVVDRFSADAIKDIMRNELTFTAERHRIGRSIFRALGHYAPAFGMIGTLIGLIFMLKSLTDATQIASSMAIALVTTFYGAILSNVIFLPIAGKLEERSQAEMLKKEMTLAGILSIQAGDVPRMVEQRMISYLPEEYRILYRKENP
jgi:chemotaxis protein MotA